MADMFNSGMSNAKDGMASAQKTSGFMSWKSSLFGCFDDIGVCLVVCIAPCLIVGQNAEDAGVTSCLLGGIATFVPLVNLFCFWQIRDAIRKKKHIEGSPLMDILTVFFCTGCAICQEARELRDGIGDVMPRA